MTEINSQLKQAFVAAAAEARQAKRTHINSILMTVGIIKEGTSRAAQLLQFAALREREFRDAPYPPQTSLYDITLPDVPSMRVSAKITEALDRATQLSRKHHCEHLSAEAMLLSLLQLDKDLKQALTAGGVGQDQQSFVETELVNFLSAGKATTLEEIDFDEDEDDCEDGTCPPGTKTKGAAKSKSKTPTLDRFGSDLTELARKGKLNPLIGRLPELRRACQILGRKVKNNPVFLGEAGVGKTALAEGIAQLIVSGRVPRRIKDKRLVMLDLTAMVAGCAGRGSFEERLTAVIREVKRASNVILFIDELHTLLGAGATSGTMDAANALKPGLARGEISTIGATTLAEYRKYIEKDTALCRRFQPVILEQPSVAQTIDILQGLKKGFEDHHGVEISDEAIKQAAELADRYIQDRFQPDKSIDLMDEAASMVIMDEDLKNDKKSAHAAADGETAKLEEEPAAPGTTSFLGGLTNGIGKWFGGGKSTADEAPAGRDAGKAGATEAAPAGPRPLVTAEHVSMVVSLATGIPVAKLTSTESQRLLQMETEIHRRVISQHAAITAVSKAIRRARAGLKDPKRPQGVFLFLGPTGVGKTEVVKALQQFLYGNEEPIRLDMSEYMEKHSVANLIGSPPGYVGYEEGGKLTDAVRRRPYSVILLDEIEKAHRDVYNMLLQIMDDGRLTDRHGRTVDFSNTIIVMTSNIGAHQLLGAVGNPEAYQAVVDQVLNEEIHKFFNPEFINRFDETVVFDPLGLQEVGQIRDLQVEKIRQRLAPRRITLTLDSSVELFLLERGFDPRFGARPMRRAIEKYLGDTITEAILRGDVTDESTVMAKEEGGCIFVVKQEGPVLGAVAAPLILDKDSAVLPVPVSLSKVEPEGGTAESLQKDPSQ